MLGGLGTLGTLGWGVGRTHPSPSVVIIVPGLAERLAVVHDPALFAGLRVTRRVNPPVVVIIVSAFPLWAKVELGFEIWGLRCEPPSECKATLRAACCALLP